MTIVALTGGIAAGKSTVANRLAHHGALIIDADELAREVVVPGSPALAAIAETFGPEVLHPEGTLNREALGALIFADPAARASLNAIVHPEVRKLSAQRFGEANTAYPDRVLVYAVPLVAESGRTDEFDLVIVVDAPREQRISRLVTYRGMSVDDATARVDAQASDDQRRAIADIIVDASGDIADTEGAADELAALLEEHWPNNLASLPTRFPSASS
jgi:dephospho-CoA kinase